MNFRVSTFKDRYLFYKKEFNIKKVSTWINYLLYKPQFYAIDFGSETKIIKYKSQYNLMIFIPKKKFKQFKLIKYLPEDVYYDRNNYKDLSKALTKKSRKLNSGNIITQELAFDIDSNNISCKYCKGKLIVCPYCLKTSHEKTLEFYDEIKKDFNEIKIIYSGRGFHIHVNDKEAYFLNLKQRIKINKKYNKFPIDEWVSKGNIRLIRLPYSLNSLVSRICIPINPNYKFERIINKKSVPKFLKS